MKNNLIYILLLLVFVGCKKDTKRTFNDRAAKIISDPSLYKNKDKVDSAIIYLDKAIMIDSKYYTAWSNKQEAYEVKLLHVRDSLEKRKILKNIVHVFDKLIKLGRSDPLLLVKQATWFEKLGFKDSADKNHQMALKKINRRFAQKKQREIDYFLKVYLLCKNRNIKKANRFYIKNAGELKKSMTFLEDMVFNDSDSLNCEEVLDHAPS